MKQSTLRVGTQTGSVMNHIMSNNASVPVVGEGATMLLWSDRNAYEVVAVNDDNTIAVIAPINAKRTDSNGISEVQEYDYSDVDMNRQFVIVYRNGAWHRINHRIVFTKDFSAWVEANGKEWRSEAHDDVRHAIYGDNNAWPQNIVEGKTRMSTKYSKISILFGSTEEYRDPCF
jgi:hypothetical protein